MGNIYGKVTGVREEGRAKGRKVLWGCRCECGNYTVVEGNRLRSGMTKSCGCLRINTIVAFNKKHGMASNRLYNIWSHMKSRCLNKNDRAYRRYGGRGITVCEEWQQFKPFMKWALENGYNDDLEIDRINNNGNYSPENCRFVTPKENSRNRRSNRLITIDGKTKTLAEWSEISGLDSSLIRFRVVNGWSEKQLLVSPSVRRSE